MGDLINSEISHLKQRENKKSPELSGLAAELARFLPWLTWLACTKTTKFVSATQWLALGNPAVKYGPRLSPGSKGRGKRGEVRCCLLLSTPSPLFLFVSLCRATCGVEVGVLFAMRDQKLGFNTEQNGQVYKHKNKNKSFG